MAAAGPRIVVVEQKLIGGSCPNVACLPSKNIIHSAKVKSLAGRASMFGLKTGSIGTDMKAVQHRKRAMVEDLVKVHLERYKAAGVELIMGHGRFVAPRTVAVEREGCDPRVLRGERVFLNVGTRATLPNVPGLSEAAPMTHVEILELDRVPEHLSVLGGVPYTALRDALFTHPTAAEGLTILLADVESGRQANSAEGKAHVRRTADADERDSEKRNGEPQTNAGIDESQIDQALADSFPASDSPPWTLGMTSTRSRSITNKKRQRR